MFAHHCNIWRVQKDISNFLLFLFEGDTHQKQRQQHIQQHSILLTMSFEYVAPEIKRKRSTSSALLTGVAVSPQISRAQLLVFECLSFLYQGGGREGL